MSHRSCLLTESTRIAVPWAWALFLLSLSACAMVHTHKSTGEEVVMTEEEFSQYVEHVFRYHNQVMSELMETSVDRVDLTSADEIRLSTAEKKMVKACESLNEVVSETLSGENVGLQLKLDLVDAVPACEKASQEVEELMP